MLLIASQKLWLNKSWTLLNLLSLDCNGISLEGHKYQVHSPGHILYCCPVIYYMMNYNVHVNNKTGKRVKNERAVNEQASDWVVTLWTKERVIEELLLNWNSLVVLVAHFLISQLLVCVQLLWGNLQHFCLYVHILVWWHQQ
jgi:hypothetical protein